MNIVPANVTVSDLTALEATDDEFLRISELVLRYSTADLAEIDDIQRIVDDRSRLQAVGRYIASVIRSRSIKLEAQNNIAEARLYQERRIGELLRELPMRNGNRPADAGCTDATPDLQDLGVSKNQSSNWQLQAKLPPAKFEDVLATAKENGWELTSKMVQAAAINHIEAVTGQPVKRYLAKNAMVKVRDVMPGVIALNGIEVLARQGVNAGDTVRVSVWIEKVESGE